MSSGSGLNYRTESKIMSGNNERMCSLKEISKWAVGINNNKIKNEKVSVSIPVLQRGLVWGAQQIEFLWDSILREFPVGSFVVCKAIENQEKKTESQEERELPEFHMLDGQQRAYAIALAFQDPFLVDSPKRVDSIIWIDLAPDEKIATSSRKFLIRLTTLSHPWGYRADEASGILKAHYIRKELEGSRRLKPVELYPFDAKCPIPLAWILSSYCEDEDCFRENILKKLEGDSHRWSASSLKKIKTENIRVKELHRAIKGVFKFSIPVLKIPSLEDGDEEISDVEVLFQRLNRQGSLLQGEELQYSMIKAYWPDVQYVVEKIKNCRIPASRIIILGVRLALTRPNAERLHFGLKISALRKMAALTTKTDKKNKGVDENNLIDKEDEENKALIKNLLIDKDGELLSMAVSRVEKWFRKPIQALPYVLISSVARDTTSGDLYLLFLYWAHVNIQIDPVVKESFSGLATYLHWFGIDKSKIVNAIFDKCRTRVSIENINFALKESVKNKWLIPIYSLECFKSGLEKYSKIESEKYSKVESEKFDFDWRWNKFLENEKLQKEKEERWWPFISRVIQNRELLLYAQREFINESFGCYDPANKEMWKNHNRPWDFDHIHPSACFYRRRIGSNLNFIREWGNTIGNLRAWPFEKNRSDQKKSLDEKLPTEKQEREKELKDSFILKGEINGFSFADSASKDASKALEFGNSAFLRLIRIYGEWLKSSGAEKFVC